METDFDLDSIITIGENAERIAYGCPKCGDHKALNPEGVE